MTKDGARRIATSDGAVLVDAESLEKGPRAESDSWFEPAYWAARGELDEVTAGRGAAWFIGAAGCWVLRHYRRGGFVARLSQDGYLWAGEDRVRAFAEWRLLAELAGSGLPVPRPVAARYRRRGMLYRCDLITQRIVDAHPLSSVLMSGSLDERTWRNIGAAVARLHAAGADHADLNAHNILVDGTGRVSVIDFDRGRLRRSGASVGRSGSAAQGVRRSAAARESGAAGQREAAERSEAAGKREAAGQREAAERSEAAGTREAAGKREAAGQSEVAGTREAAGKREAAGQSEVAGTREAAGQSEAPGYDAGGYGGERVAPVWALRNLSRLQRSLAKIGRGFPAGRCSAVTWEWLMAGYVAVLAETAG